MSDIKVNPYQQSAASVAAAGQHRPNPAPTKSSKAPLYSISSLLLFCALGYLTYQAATPFLPTPPRVFRHGSNSTALSSGGRPLKSPSAVPPYVPLAYPPGAAHAGPSCHELPNSHPEHFLTSVCCDLRASAPADGSAAATLWLVRNATLDAGLEDFRIKAHGLAEKRRAGRQLGSSKLERPSPEADGYSYRYDFNIPMAPKADDDMETYVAPSLNVWFQTASPIIDVDSAQAKRYARMFEEPIDLSALACARPANMPLSMRFMRD